MNRTPGLVHILRADPDLAEGLAPEMARQAEELVRARGFEIPAGAWRPPELAPGAIGLLILDGLMARTVRLGNCSSSELVGPGDILRPWEQNLIPSLVPAEAEWTVIESASVALLDARVTALLGRWPELMGAIAARLLRRTRSLAYVMAAQQFIRVEDRLLATLWHLASLWGKVTPQGTLVPFRLTQETLGNLIGAQRPTTTLAVGSLIRKGRLTRDGRRRYVLLGEPPSVPVPTRHALGRRPRGVAATERSYSTQVRGLVYLAGQGTPARERACPEPR
jgi:CRP/FNR family transcriptional regulator, cyclic AMP receptor protein